MSVQIGRDNLLELNKAYNMDCFKGMSELATGSVDLILVDLPYGKTRNTWDEVIPHSRMWHDFWRVLKPNGNIVLFGQGIFSVKLIQSMDRFYRYTITWDKVLPTGFLNSKRMPLRVTEDIHVFYKKAPTYNPQMVVGNPCHKRGTATGKNCKQDGLNQHNYGDYVLVETEGDLKYPQSLWRCQKPHPSVAIHPTQKPVGLLCKLIETYSNADELVLDCCCGSGSTLVAAKLTGRKYIGFDSGYCEKKQPEYAGKAWADITNARLQTAETERVEDVVMVSTA